MSNPIIYYSWIGANKAGVTDHPQADLKRRGVETFKYEAFGIGDCSFIEVDRLPEPCPDYIELAPQTFRFTK